MGKISLSTVINQLVVIEKRNNLIIDLLKKDMADNRKTILLTDRRNHCEILFSLVQQHIPSSTVGLYMGGMKQNELEKSEKCDIILATFSLAHEGLDIPTLDTLILASPKTDIIQSCGRILRETVGKKNTPLIHDIVDRYASLPSQALKRRKYYVESGFIVNGNKTKKPVKHMDSYSFIEE